MTEPTKPRNDASPDPDDAGEPDPRIDELVARIRRSRDPASALLRPLSPEDRRALADRVLASVAASRAAAPSAAAPKPLLRRIRASWLVPAFAVAAGVGALAFGLGRPGTTLTAYHLEVEGDAPVRGDTPAAATRVELRPETKLRVRLAPDQPVRDASLRLLVVRGGKATVLSPPSSQDGQGTFTITETAGALLGAQADGEVELVFAVGRPLPDDAELARLAADPTAKVPPEVRMERRAARLTGFSLKTGDIGFSGCSLGKGACELAAGAPIRIWAPGADGSRFSIRVDGREAKAPLVPIEGGIQWTLDVPEGARAVTLAFEGGELFRLPIAPAPASPRMDEAEARLRRGELDAAEAQLDALDGAAPPGERLAALRVRARIARRKGQRARAKALREEAIEADRAEGRLTFEVDDQLARIFELLYEEGGLADAKRRLDALAEAGDGDPESRVKLDYYRGLFASEVGDLREALASLRAARRGARRLGMKVYETAVASPLSDLASSLGRYDEAEAILAGMEQDPAGGLDPCDRAHLVMNRGWILLRSGRIEEAGRRLEEAAAASREGCARVLGDVLTNLAFARVEAGRPGDARALVAEARAARRGPDARMKIWQERLAIDLAIEADPRAALAASDEVRRAGEEALSPELLFEGELARARALDKLGEAGDAARAYAAAEQALDAWGTLVPLSEGREAFLERQERASRLWIDFLRREADRPRDGAIAGEALARAARRSVARFYRVLRDGDRAGALSAGSGEAWAGAIGAYRAARARIDAARAAGKPPSAEDRASLAKGREGAAARLHAEGAPSLAEGAEPAAPGEGELFLVYHPLREGWLGVAWTPDGVVWKELGAVDPHADRAALAAALLAPFRDRVDRARRIRVHAHRALAAVPFHALPWGRGALLDRAPVTYGVDLPAIAAAPSACGGAPSALVVADARENLAGAGAAAGAIPAALAARGWTVKLLRGGEARLDAVKCGLADPCVRLFHYEGHAVFQGRDGVDAALLLADGRLSAAEILSLPRVPEAAVLSGCSTAEADGLGLAHAFLARGAREVLATTAPIEDRAAILVAERLYAPGSPAAGTPPDLAAGWRATASGLPADEGAVASLYRVLQR